MIADALKSRSDAVRKLFGVRPLSDEEMLLLLAEEIAATYTHEEAVVRS